MIWCTNFFFFTIFIGALFVAISSLFSHTLLPCTKMSLRKKRVQYINCFVAAFGTEHTNKQAKSSASLTNIQQWLF